MMTTLDESYAKFLGVFFDASTVGNMFYYYKCNIHTGATLFRQLSKPYSISAVLPLIC